MRIQMTAIVDTHFFGVILLGVWGGGGIGHESSFLPEGDWEEVLSEPWPGEGKTQKEAQLCLPGLRFLTP